MCKRKLSKLLVQFRTSFQPKLQSKVWAGEKGDEYSVGYIGEVSKERNFILWELLLNFDANIFVEIGSNLGSKIIGLAQGNPEITVLGLDVNRKAIGLGKKIAKELELENISFREFDITSDDFSKLNIDFSNSVIFSWATLIYIHPVDILKLLKAIVCRDFAGFVLIEQHSELVNLFSKRGKFISGGTNYLRDYVYLLNKIGASRNYDIEVRSVPAEFWDPGGGYAHMIIGTRKKL